MLGVDWLRFFFPSLRPKGQRCSAITASRVNLMPAAAGPLLNASSLLSLTTVIDDFARFPVDATANVCNNPDNDDVTRETRHKTILFLTHPP